MEILLTTDSGWKGISLTVPPLRTGLYSGNERLRMNGVNEYDFNARRYNSALGCFTTWDPLAENRPWESPYAFCDGDPGNNIDPQGMDIFILNKGDVGEHLAMLIENKEGRWEYFSVNGDNVYVSGHFLGGLSFDDLRVGEGILQYPEEE